MRIDVKRKGLKQTGIFLLVIFSAFGYSAKQKEKLKRDSNVMTSAFKWEYTSPESQLKSMDLLFTVIE